jgi:hemoglobin-like flavoprotein
MTAKNKAKELLDKMENIAFKHDCFGAEYPVAKECALIAVDEILKVAFYANDKIYNHYLEVKQQINKL